MAIENNHKVGKETFGRLQIEDLESKLVDDKTPFEEDDELGEWLEDYKEFPSGIEWRLWSQERKDHMRWLFRYALAEVDPNEVQPRWRFSLCRRRWYRAGAIYHCSACKTCQDADSWHCGACRKCVWDHEVPCTGCGGLSRVAFEARTGRA